MNRVHVGVFAFICLVATVSWPQQQAKGMTEKAPAREGQSASNAERQQYPTDSAPLAVRIIETPGDEKDRKRRETDAAKHETEDLKAQIRSAEASEKQVLVGIAAAVLSCFGLLAVGWSLVLTRQSVVAANRAATAAEGAVTMASNSAEKQLRAYLWTMVKVKTFVEIEGGYFGVDSIIRNSGQTPAKKVRAWAKMALLDADLPDGFEFDTSPPADFESDRGFILNPHGKYTLHTQTVVPLEDSEYGNVHVGVKLHYLWGAVHYDDGFSKSPRLATFRLYRRTYVSDGKAMQIWCPCSDGNNAN